MTIGAVCLLGALGVGMFGPGQGGALPIASMTQADAAISRGGGEGGEGGGNVLQGGTKLKNIAVAWVGALLFILAAIGVGIAAANRDAKQAIVVLGLSIVIGTLVFTPDLVKHFIESVAQYVL
jgi:hypothetical protein